ncbi:unnamed protein product, partial [marine sediment metagenome]
MTTILVIVAEVISYKPNEMPLAKDDDVFEELSTTTEDPAFRGVTRWPRLAERHPEGSIDVHDRWARALLLKRRHLLSQREVFQHEVGAAATHRPDGTRTERDDEDENLEHRGRSVPVPWRDLT